MGQKRIKVSLDYQPFGVPRLNSLDGSISYWSGKTWMSSEKFNEIFGKSKSR